MGSSFLEKFVSTAPAVAKLFVGENLGFYATDLTKFLMVYEHNFEVPFAKPGLEFKQGGESYKEEMVNLSEILETIAAKL